MFKRRMFLSLILGLAGWVANAEGLDWKKAGPPGGVCSFLTVDPANPAHLWTGRVAGLLLCGWGVWMLVAR